MGDKWDSLVARPEPAKGGSGCESETAPGGSFRKRLAKRGGGQVRIDWRSVSATSPGSCSPVPYAGTHSSSGRAVAGLPFTARPGRSTFSGCAAAGAQSRGRRGWCGARRPRRRDRRGGGSSLRRMPLAVWLPPRLASSKLTPTRNPPRLRWPRGGTAVVHREGWATYGPEVNGSRGSAERAKRGGGVGSGWRGSLAPSRTRGPSGGKTRWPQC